MYIYFDTNGTIKEIVNDKSIRQGSTEANKIYCYIEGNPTIDDIWYMQKLPSGETSNEVSFKNSTVTKAIPYNAKRDMRYFKDFEQYTFYVFTLNAFLVSQKGLNLATIRIVVDNEIFALGELTFNVQENVINVDNGITISQYDYLLLAYASRTLNEQTGSDLDKLLDDKIEAKANDIIEPIFNDYKETIDEEVESQNETIASLIQASPRVFDTANNITLLTENKGVAVATDTGYIYYWNSTLSTPAYVSSGLQYNSLIGYAKHSGNQLQDENNKPFSPNVANIKLQFTKGDFNTSGQVTTNIYRIVTTMDYIFPVDIKVDIDYVTYYIYLYQYENNAWVGKGWQGSIFTISANTKFRLIVSTRATLTQNLSFYQYTNMVNSLRIIPSSDFNYNSIIGFKKYKNYGMRDVAHRGLSMYAPENTASAFKSARLFGFEYVECDIHYTSDDVPVIIHDYTINRTSNGTGNVADLTLEQLKSYDFGSWFNDAYEGEQILTLEEFIVLIKKLGLKAYIELKNIGSWQVRARHAQEIVALIKSYNMLDNVIFISASGTYVEEIKNVAPSVTLGYVSSNLNLEDSDVIRFLSLKTSTNKLFFDLENNSNITQSIVDYAIANDISIETWLINDTTPLFLINKYISGVTTNGIMPSECIIDKALQEE